ncbi:flagellar hook-length control protein FliK [Ramlibacter sp.]|uniref:flagellar hook-length control protein FliK n=1 Tax=Ramlibacter sp. TaxID=1917967 RepID=UPI002B8CBC4D|nr:flagellar hook-length control protein FliK [Ramlibacter sp.]HWI83367.1 flagellar hook-length control protein FliK [Ramlibacter sp.]
MSAPTALADTLLADRLAPRAADALRLPSAGAVTAPAPPSAVTAVANDVRLLPQAAGQQALPAAVAPPPGPAAAQALSATGLAISELLAQLPAPAGPVRGAAPLAADRAASAAALGRGLADALAGSGLFYESHLARAASGSFELATLRQEPQAAWGPRGAAAGRAGDAATDAPARQDDAPAGERRAEIVHPQARTLVAQQLDVLATGVFRWSGEAWPGVPMDWAVQEEATPDAAQDGDGAPARRWSTTFAVALPALGPVEVRLSLAGAQLRGRVAAAPAADAPLRAAQGELQLQLAGAGLKLPELAIVATGTP